jgi:hypothetical protein
MVNNKSLCNLVTMCVSCSGYMSLMLCYNSFDQRSESICLRYFIVLSQSSRSEAEDDYLNSVIIDGYWSWLQTSASRMELRCITVEVTR